MIEYVSPEGLRVDGRRPKELRSLSAEMGVLATADGSATFQMGNTKARYLLLYAPHPLLYSASHTKRFSCMREGVIPGAAHDCIIAITRSHQST